MQSRQQDINALLAEVNENISIIEEEIKKVILDNSIKEILKPKVKTCLEHLRSCLDFCAHDIYEAILQPLLGVPKGNIYFPYGKTFEDFFQSLDRTKFKQLRRYNEGVYLLIESIQPFKSKKNWLVDLCKHTNNNKHDRLGNQERKDGLMLGPVKVDNKSTLFLHNCSISNKRIKNVLFNKGQVFTDTDLDKLGLYIVNWADFTFQNTDINILKLLKDAYKNINEFQTELYDLLTC